MFKAVITEKCTKIEGKIDEILAGLAMYIRALKENDISEKIIREVVNIALKDSKKNKVETILDNDKMKVQKFDLNGLSKEEAEEILKKELFNKLFN